MNGFEKRKERKKEIIWRAALQLYMQHGIRKISVKEIADHANVSQVTIYNYFGSKDELSRYTIEAYMNEQLHAFEDLVHSERSFMEKLDWFFSKKDDAFDSMNLSFLDTFVSSDPEMAELLISYEQKITPLMVTFIEQGQAEHYFNKELSIETLLFYIHLFSSQAMKQLEQMPDGEAKRRVYKELLVVFFDGVRGK
ncbi:TetR/AcrR family transcriptional regulator [Alkalicoccobacillus porphyridii]|uniref:TetR/AcrR family transcriptional regulator n=1 Tax=Alkalicoccobacillus porphyridii TaxID=2597270 RepID=A0A553ZX15_9BACI|nr:TetR/AcrR family transcriptional regulator [Alkalicoccobacillus porphyridii]TSB46000.1 TetR/AcrR family transcriptional regulator [Alkalicoccobacillus porphyridii]